MKIIIIRHEKVDMTWEKKYNSVTYDLACNKYDESPIVLSDKEYSKKDDAKTVYISELSRTYETACRLFSKEVFIKTALLNEVPLKSFKDTNKMYPLWIWNFVGRVQWLLESNRQAESKKKTIIRAKEMIKLLEENQEDCYLVTHGFFMRVLIKELKKRGYTIRNNNFLGISNLDMIVAIKQSVFNRNLMEDQ